MNAQLRVLQHSRGGHEFEYKQRVNTTLVKRSLVDPLRKIVKRFSGQKRKKRLYKTSALVTSPNLIGVITSIGTGGFEPPTSSMSRKRSPPELRAYKQTKLIVELGSRVKFFSLLNLLWFFKYLIYKSEKTSDTPRCLTLFFVCEF